MYNDIPIMYLIGYITIQKDFKGIIHHYTILEKDRGCMEGRSARPASGSFRDRQTWIRDLWRCVEELHRIPDMAV